MLWPWAHGTGAEAIRRQDILDDRRAHRGAPGRKVLNPDPVASAASTDYAKTTVYVGDDLMLMSDGVSDLIAAYRAYDEAGFIALYEDLRRIETDDAACLTFPRFKLSDDATAPWLRVAA